MGSSSGCFLPLEACIVHSGTMKAIRQEELSSTDRIQISSNSGVSELLLNGMVSSIVGPIFASRGQPRETEIGCMF